MALFIGIIALLGISLVIMFYGLAQADEDEEEKGGFWW